MKQTSLLLLFTALTSVASAGSWDSFQNGGNILIPADQPVRLGEVRWNTPLSGYGQSSPVVHDALAYVTTVEGDNRERYHITAIHLKDGQQAWQYSVDNPSPRKNTTYLSRSAPTPAVDGRGLVSFLEGGIIVALNHQGELQWQRDLVADYGNVDARHGLAASVEQNEESVFVWVERSEDPFIVCLDKQNGETKWKSEGLGATSWSSPRLVPVAGGSHLVLSASGQLAGLDPATGERLWLMDDISGNSTPTPVPLGDGRFLIGATTGRGESGGGRAAASNGVVEIRRADDGSWSAGYVWRAKRATSSFGSPVVHAGVACFVNRTGVLYGLDAATGEELFAQRLKGSTWATPIAIGNQLFFFCRDGKVCSLLASDPQQPVRTWDGLPAPPKSETESHSGGGPPMLGGAVLYAAAWLDDSVLIRRGDQLFAVGVVLQE